MSTPSSGSLQQSTWDPSKYATLKDEVRALRYYRKRNADLMGRRIAKGGRDPRAPREKISMSDVDKRYEEFQKSDSGIQLIQEVIMEEEAIEATKQQLLQA
ncbi:hypothetical protein FS837_004592 [Tulasnella sp. UAMH 9824]|nr:hypothetical protein FS837_004592 [Tulasnella sp. UAMH 9824]